MGQLTNDTFDPNYYETEAWLDEYLVSKGVNPKEFSGTNTIITEDFYFPEANMCQYEGKWYDILDHGLVSVKIQWKGNANMNIMKEDVTLWRKEPKNKDLGNIV